MRVVPIEDLLPEVLRHAPNVAEPAALRALREAAREFCRRTMMWREHDTIAVTTPACEAVITMQDAAVLRIEHARFDGVPLEPVTVAVLDRTWPGWQSEPAGANSPRHVTQLMPNTLAVVPKATGTLALTLILQPSRTAGTLPAFLAEDHAEDVGKGAAARILLLPNAATGKPEYGARLEADWRRRLDELAPRGARGQHGAPVRSPARFF